MSENKDRRLQALDELSQLEQELFVGGSRWGGTSEIAGLRLVCTCSACPEQYDVLTATGKQVGYLRLRRGYFRADVPDCGGETVYEAKPRGDGVFEADERERYLSEAVAAIKAHIDQGRKPTEAE
jgi:hypothetical protein